MRCLPAAIAALLASGAIATAQDRLDFKPVPPGSDFCVARTYDVAHFSAHPKQIISSIQIMGRNAWRAVPRDGTMMASLVVSFRDTAKPLVMAGRCARDETNAPDTLRCKFVLDTLQDSLGQRIRLEWTGADAAARADADWKVLRARKEPNGPYPPSTDDANFLLRKTDIAACRFPAGHWTQSGPTQTFIGLLP
jgi:hypothetical protein